MAASFRYIVNNVEEVVPFYRDLLGFEVVMNPAPGFAMLKRGDLRLLLNAPGAGVAGQSGKDGTPPAPGGWARFQLEVEDLEATIAELEAGGATFRTGLIVGNGGNQALVEDPSGNVIELFQPPAQRGTGA